jgi:hypothetical protein
MTSQGQRNTGGQGNDGTDLLIGFRNRPFLPRGRRRERKSRDLGSGEDVDRAMAASVMPFGKSGGLQSSAVS